MGGGMGGDRGEGERGREGGREVEREGGREGGREAGREGVIIVAKNTFQRSETLGIVACKLIYRDRPTNHLHMHIVHCDNV